MSADSPTNIVPSSSVKTPVLLDRVRSKSISSSSTVNPAPDNPDQTSTTTYSCPWSTSWVSQRLMEVSDRAIGILRSWVHKKRPLEAGHETLRELRSLPEEQRHWALEELARPKQ